MARITFQGLPGSYSYLAAQHHFPAMKPDGARDFGGVIAAVRSGRSALGLLPIENSVIGPILEASARLAEADDVVTIEEVTFPVMHCLLALPGADLRAIRWVESHPAALAQCAQWLSRHQMVPRAVEDTAGAARDIAVDRDYTRAAIASAEAGELYGLVVLAPNIADAPSNATRFAVLQRHPDAVGGEA